ncbi:MAG: hypothetical protein FWG61_09240 [Firmicutes bacterium]|nr:hypothetical protein [Bacillota bacterium]
MLEEASIEIIRKCPNHCLPAYTSVVCGLLTNADTKAEDLKKRVLKNILTQKEGIGMIVQWSLFTKP